MATNSDLRISTSKADMQQFAQFEIVHSAGKTKSRINLLVDDVADLRFNVACVKASEASIFDKIIYHFTHVKMTVGGKAIYINKNSAAKRLGLTVEQVKGIAGADNLAMLQAMAAKRKEIHDFFDNYYTDNLDITNITHRTYYVFMKNQECLYSKNGEQLDNLRDCRTRLLAFSQFEYHRLSNNDNLKLFQINGCLFAIAKFDKPTRNDPPNSYLSIEDNFALVHLNTKWEKQTPSFKQSKYPKTSAVSEERFIIDANQKIARVTPIFHLPTETRYMYYENAFKITPEETGRHSRFQNALLHN